MEQLAFNILSADVVTIRLAIVMRKCMFDILSDLFVTPALVDSLWSGLTFTIDCIVLFHGQLLKLLPVDFFNEITVSWSEDLTLLFLTLLNPVEENKTDCKDNQNRKERHE